VYKYFWNGSEKIQSAWCRWHMAGEVSGLVMLDADLYLVMRYPGDGMYLEKMRCAPGHKDDGEAFEYCLDRKVTERDITIGAWNPVTRTTTVTLPYAVPEGVTPLIVTRSAGGAGVTPGRLLPQTARSADGRSFTIRADLRNAAVPLFAGLPFTSFYTFSTLAVREDGGKGNAVTAGRLQLRHLTLNCVDTGMLRMHVTPSFRPTSTYTFTGREMGHGTNILGETPLYTGVIKCPVLSVNTQVTLAVSSDSFLPFSLVNAGWEGFYTSRSQRV
ncbi:MAG: hypothetical protein K2O70_05100, partial [Desulfovibrionaceae bacterium]|nr:hypothetical protein [Desulfovibrionaceae bacterium]